MAKEIDAAPYVERTRASQRKADPLRNVDMSSNDAYKTWEKLKAEAMKRRAPWINTFQEIYDFTMPMRESFIESAVGEGRTDLIYDDTAVQAVPKLASRLTAGYLPEYGEIFTLHAGRDAPDHMKGYEGAMKLRTLTAWIHEAWQDSNLSAEASEGMIDLAIGTMNLCQEPGKYPGEVVFTAVDPSGIAILPGAAGQVKGWFTWRKLALEDVFVTYKRAKKTDQIKRALKDNPRQEVRLECGTWLISDDDDEKCRYVVILPGFKEAIVDEVFKGEGCCPWSTTRWSKVGRDVWGRGPLMLAMAGIKTVNITTQMILENGEIALGGMWTYTDDGVFNPDNIVLAPGTFIPTSREGTVSELKNSTRFDLSQLMIAQMQQNIKRNLYVDEMDSTGQTPLSAYELQARRADIARDLTAPGGRITKECIIKHVNRTIWIFEKQGILDAMGLRVDGKRLKIKVKSPFLRGQDAIEMNDIMTGAGQMNAIFGQGTAGMVFKLDETIAGIVKRNGIDPRMVKREEELKKMFQQAGAQAQEAGAIAPGGADGTQLASLVADMAKS